MTNKEAANLLIPIRNDYCHLISTTNDDIASALYKCYVEALKIAINTLNSQDEISKWKDRPVGIWESLGHRIGLFKHPDSEDYKCSLCGYKAYTIYSSPPQTCPNCGAYMKNAKSIFSESE